MMIPNFAELCLRLFVTIDDHTVPCPLTSSHAESRQCAATANY